MGRSLGLSLYLLAAGRSGTAPPPELPARPEGDVVWLHADPGARLKGLAQLATRMQRERRTLRFVVTAEGAAPDLAGFPPQSVACPMVPDRLAAVRMALGHFRPAALILTGASLPPALIHEAAARGVPLILADARLAAGAVRRRWRWRRGMAGSLLGRLDLILARDEASAALLRQLGGRGLAVEVTGEIEETTDPLPCVEAEREDIAAQFQARPVWLAMACPEAEEAAVISAHAAAMRFAHRLLLILVPADPARGPVLADALARDGWSVALRSREEEPEEDIQIFVADGEGELGLMYRLAPVTFMGGTLAEGCAGRNPFEPAALGSAILHGPHPAPYPEAYARLDAARASRSLRSAEDLAEAVSDLIAPDKAAVLAHNAWQVSSGGAEVTERVMQLIFNRIDAWAARAGRGGG